MEKQKQRVKRLEECVAQAKAKYAKALRNLEQISDEIHKVTIRREKLIVYNKSIETSFQDVRPPLIFSDTQLRKYFKPDRRSFGGSGQRSRGRIAESYCK